MNTPFSIYKPIIGQKMLLPRALLTKKINEIADRIKIIVHIIPMKLPGGVNEGFMIVGYHEVTPWEVKRLPTCAITR